MDVIKLELPPPFPAALRWLIQAGGYRQGPDQLRAIRPLRAISEEGQTGQTGQAFVFDQGDAAFLSSEFFI